MKNFFTCLLLLVASVSYSQTTEIEESPDPRDTAEQELSINAFNLVVFGIADLSYERIISENSTWAVEGFYHPGKDDYFNDAYYKKLSLTGKYKHFSALIMHEDSMYMDSGCYLMETTRQIITMMIFLRTMFMKQMIIQILP